MKKVALSKVAKIDRTVATDDECLTLPYVGLEHVEKERGRFVEDFVPTPLNMLATNFRFTPKHVLYGKLRPYLNKVVLPNFDGVCTTEILPILPNEEKLDRTFLWAILLSPTFVNWATSQISGANLPRLDPKLLAEYEIPLPPLDEQKRIASLLARADRLRQLRRHARRLADSLLQSLFVEMFGDPRTNPKGWKVEKVGKHIKNIRYGTGSPPDYQEKGVPFIRATNVKQGTIKAEGLVYISEEDANKISKCRVNAGDLIIVRSGINSGDCALIPPEYNGAYAAYDLILEVDYPTNCFLNTIINSTFGKQTIATLSRRAGQPHVNAEQVEFMEFPFPPLPLQEEFARAAARVESLRRRMSEAERQAEGLFESLLALSFTEAPAEAFA